MGQRPRGHVREHGRGRWRLEVELPPDPVTGRRRRLSRVVDAPSRRAALDAFATFASEARTSARPTCSTDLTVDELLDRWLEHRGDAVEETATVHEWTQALRRYVRPRLGDARVADVRSYDIDQLYRSLLRDGGRGGRPLKGSTVRKVHLPLRQAFAQAVRWGWLPSNPVADATPPRVGKVHLPPPDVAAAARLLAYADEHDPDAAAIWRLDASSGARRGELAGIQWSDVDLDGAQVAIHRVVKRIDRRVVVVDYPKTSSSRRRVALGRATVTALKAMRIRAVERALAGGVQLRPDAFLLSLDVAGRTPLNPAVLSTRLPRLAKAAGVERITPQALRRFMATQALGAGVDVRTVAGRGGWANATTLLQRYAHFLPARDQAAAQALDNLLGDQTAEQ